MKLEYLRLAAVAVLALLGLQLGVDVMLAGLGYLLVNVAFLLGMRRSASSVVADPG